MKILFTYSIRHPNILREIRFIENEALINKSEEFIIQYIRNIQPSIVVSKNDDFINILIRLKNKNQVSKEIKIIKAFDHKKQHSKTNTYNLESQVYMLEIDEPDLSEVRLLQLIEDIVLGEINIPKIERPARVGDSITLIGAGIVNLVIALFLVQKGYKVSLFDAGPEPYEEHLWKEYGCSFGGNDARIFSFNESRQHHYKGDPLIEINNQQYRNEISNDGWLCCPPNSLSNDVLSWIEEFERYPGWLFEKINREIINFNKESYQYWVELKQEIEEVFLDIGYVDKLFRVYESQKGYENGKKAELELGSKIRDLSKGDIIKELSCLKNALENKAISGAIEVKGFGVNIHKLMLRLISFLQKKGAIFHWNEKIQEICFDNNGSVQAVKGKSREIISDYYVLSPGVPINDLLAGTSTFGQIGAMVGCWLTLPNLEPQLKYPLKVQRAGYASAESAAGANVIPAKNSCGDDVIYISSGHGFIGKANNIHINYVKDLEKAAHETAKKLFPVAYRKAQSLGILGNSIRYCIRPWTPSCLGIFEMLSTASGGMMVIAGGHNTGGFSQSTAVASAVISAFEGNYHTMHHLYHPKRTRNFFNLTKPHLSSVNISK